MSEKIKAVAAFANYTVDLQGRRFEFGPNKEIVTSDPKDIEILRKYVNSSAYTIIEDQLDKCTKTNEGEMTPRQIEERDKELRTAAKSLGMVNPDKADIKDVQDFLAANRK